MGTVAGSRHADDILSHGICGSCVDNFTFQKGAPLQQYLDSIPVPVFAVDGDVIVQAVNSSGCEVLGKGHRDIVRRLGGDVFECARSRLPEGCGRTIHCSGCAIRRTVTRTYETGEPQSGVPATLFWSDPGRPSDVVLTITTVRVGGIVLLRVDRMDKASS